VSGETTTANLLGAVALAIADRTSSEAATAAGQSVSAAAALSALSQYLDGTTLERLRQVLGLTPSGAVRLVDRLAAAGLATRGPGADGRARAVSLTGPGRRAAEKVRRARLGALDSVLEPLTRDETAALQDLLAKLMTTIVAEKDGGAWLCRLCDLPACGRDEGRCPAANAARAKYGPPPPA
jgi:DNA-binding MarR family transcriptional regulator